MSEMIQVKMSEMIQVKMFEIISNYSDDDRGFIKGITDWQYISEEDFEYVKCKLPSNLIMIRKIEQEEFDLVIADYIANMKKDQQKSAKKAEDYLVNQKVLAQKRLDKKLKAAEKLLLKHSKVL